MNLGYFWLLAALLFILPFLSAEWTTATSVFGQDWNNPEYAADAYNELAATYDIPTRNETTYLEFDFEDSFVDSVRFGTDKGEGLSAKLLLFYQGSWHTYTIDLANVYQPLIEFDEIVFLEKAQVQISNGKSYTWRGKIFWFQYNSATAPTPTPNPSPSPTPTPSLTPSPIPSPTPTPSPNPTPTPSVTPTSTPLQTPIIVPTPTQTPTLTPALQSKCTPGWKCKDTYREGYQDQYCVWSMVKKCESQCNQTIGQCATPVPTPTQKETSTPTQTEEPIETPSLDCGHDLKNGECHKELKPTYCDKGELKIDCKKCGCLKGEECNNQTGKCENPESAESSDALVFNAPLENQPFSVEGKTLDEISLDIVLKGDSEPERDSINAKLITAHSEQDILLERDEKTGTYRASLKEGIPLGEQMMRIELGDGLDLNKTIYAVLVPLPESPEPMAIMALITISITLMFLLNFARNRFRDAGEKIEKQRFEIAKRKRMLKDLKLQYYKRRVSEEEYKEMSLKISSELKELGKEKKKQ